MSLFLEIFTSILIASKSTLISSDSLMDLFLNFSSTDNKLFSENFVVTFFLLNFKVLKINRKLSHKIITFHFL